MKIVPSKGSGDMERVNHMTLKCDHDLEYHRFCASSHGEEHLGEV